MPYCEIAIEVNENTNPNDLLNSFAIEQCNAQQAHQLDGRQFNIDSGMNDLRAVRQDESEIYGFFCRYAEDVKSTHTKITAFADNHADECKLVDLSRKLRI